jgi:hypothetical protein
MTKIYAIRNKDGEFQSFNGKVAWLNRAGAKSSWNAVTNRYKRGGGIIKWDDQTLYEIVELTEIVHMYEDLCK